jgi:hypothetical protein
MQNGLTQAYLAYTKANEVNNLHKDTAGFMHDIDNNGTVDLIMHTLNTTNGADIEIYTTNSTL